jgi:hypothetical protein
MRDEQAKHRKNSYETQLNTHSQHYSIVTPAKAEIHSSPKQAKPEKLKHNNFKALATIKIYPTFFYSKTKPFHHAGNSQKSDTLKPAQPQRPMGLKKHFHL